MTRKKRISDAEYVERVRRDDRNIRRRQWLWPVGCVILSCMLVYLMCRLPNLMELLPDEKKLAGAGVVLGCLFGLAFGQISFGLGLFIKQWRDARHGFRTERLMLKYHDELMNEDASNKDAARYSGPAAPRT